MSTRTSGPNEGAPRGQLAALLLYDLSKALHADRQLVEAFPKLARAAQDDHLRRLCREGVDFTEERIGRLNRVFDLLGSEPRVRASPAMKGLIRNALNAANVGFEGTMRDAAMLDAMLKISHLGRAGYWMVVAYAEALGNDKITSILMQSLKEKEEAIDEMMRMVEVDIVPRIQREDRSQAVIASVPPRARRARSRNGKAAARPHRAQQRRSA